MRPLTGLGFRYARALLSCLTKKEKNEWLQKLDILRYTLGKLVTSPAFLHARPEKRREVLEGFFNLPYFKRFIDIIIDNNRLVHIVDIIDAFRFLYYKELGMRIMKIQTAGPIRKSEVKKVLNLTSSYKIDWVVNPSIIGGIVIDMDFVCIDASTRSQIHQLQEYLLRIA